MINIFDKPVIRYYMVASLGAALSQDRSAHFYCYNCASIDAS